MTASFPPWLLACPGFLFLLIPYLVVCSFAEMSPFLLVCLIHWRISAHNVFLNRLCFLAVGSDISFLIHDFINFSLLSSF